MGNLNQLAVAYRPTTFEEVVGHELSVRALRGMVESKDLPTGLLFTGASGTGKTTLARIIANELDADTVEVDAASHGGVADVRKLTEGLKYTSGSKYSVFILDEAHSLTRDAFNALLKTLEEPPPGTLFILVTTDPHKLPMTVRTRLIEFDFGPLAPIDILKRILQVVKAEGIKTSAELVKYIASNSSGSVRQALTSLGLCASTDIINVSEYVKLTGNKDRSLEMVELMVKQDLAGLFEVSDDALTHVSSPQVVVSQIITLLKELMIIRATSSEFVVEDIERKKRLVNELHAERIFALQRILWDLKINVKTKGDPRTDLELALALMYDVVNKGKSEKLQNVIKSDNEALTAQEINELTQ